MNQRLDEQIISQIKQGDTACFAQLVDQYKQYCVGGLIRKTGCDEDEAEELFIESLLEFRDKVISGRLEQVMNLKSYLFGIGYNMWLNRQKQRRKHQDNESDIERFYYNYLEDDIFGSELDYKEELLKLSTEALANLDDKCKKLISYYYLDNLNMAEIAEKLDFSSSDVAKTSKSRCFKKLLENVKELEKTTYQ